MEAPAGAVRETSGAWLPWRSASDGFPNMGSGSYLDRKVLVQFPDAFLDSPHFCAVQFHFRIKSISVNKCLQGGAVNFSDVDLTHVKRQGSEMV